MVVFRSYRAILAEQARAREKSPGYDRAVTSNSGDSGNSGVPSRRSRDQRPRQDGDALAGPADYTRPSNPWPRLLAFGAFVVAMLFIGGLCFASFTDTPDREIRVRHTEYEEGLPKFLPVTAFGFDSEHRTFGAFLAVPVQPGPAFALLSRDPDSGCNVVWEALTADGDTLGIYADPCSDARYAFDGTALHPDATRDLHRFAVTREETGYVVNFEEITLGACRNGTTEGCSPEGQPVTRPVPKGELPPDFGD